MSTFRIIECSGTPRECGRQTGEQLRAEIREHLELGPEVGPHIPDDQWRPRRATYVARMKEAFAEYLEELEGVAEGADLPLNDIHRINMMMWPDTLRLPDGDGCTNIAFTAGPDGPVWGKNNDGFDPANARPACARIVRPNKGIPSVTFTFCGTIAMSDGMNAEGLALGHSSVGSKFQQSDHHMPIRPWSYKGLQTCRTTAEFVAHMASKPTRGKGYSMVVLDKHGSACSLEAPCPLLQVRAPEPGAAWILCVNAYLLPPLKEADQRTVECKNDALARAELLKRELANSESLSEARMRELLSLHGEKTGVCRHWDREIMNTDYSMIGLPAQGKALVAPGHPCHTEYRELTP